jgi:hypothetical protein
MHRFSWRKSGSTVDPDFGSAWNINLDLVSRGNRHCGNLVVFRRYSQRDLQLDINLLTSDFAVTLADALQRTMAENVEFIPLPEPAAIFSAQAG